MKLDDAPLLAPASTASLRSLFDRQRLAHQAEPFPSWSTRADRLKRLQRLLTRHEAAIQQAIDADFGGRPAIETSLAEVWPSLEEIKTALRHGAGWMKPRRAAVSKWFVPARTEVVPLPLGVVGVIVPWNYPLYLAVGPMVAAMVAGNRVMVKMSELTPAFSALFERLCAEAFSLDEVAVVNGDAQVAAQFSALPFNHLLFTGSTAVGRHVMAAAAAQLTPVTLELGGKSPAIVTPGYPLAHAVQRILIGKMLNAGQTCIAPDYVLLPRSEIPAFIELARAQARQGYVAGLADADYCSVVNDRHYRRLTQALDEAVAGGARAETLFNGPARDDARHRLAPTLVLDAPEDSSVMRDEIFGPLLPLVPYDRLEDAIAYVQARPQPLSLYWFDRDTARTERALAALPAGGVTVNDTLLHITQDDLPFGGVGPSGMGRYHGPWGFETFSHLQGRFHQARVNGMALFMPPYSPLMRRLLGWMKRF